MNHGLKRLPDLLLSVRLIREMHERLLQDMRGGRSTPAQATPITELDRSSLLRPARRGLRSSSVRGDPACTGRSRDISPPGRRFPPPHSFGLAYAQFETVHPFFDGYRRVGRLLVAFFLCERKILAKPVLYISHFFKRHRAEYYERLQAVRHADDWDGWMAFLLCGVAEVGDEAVATVRRILNLRERHRAAVTAHLGRATGNGHRVLEALYRKPMVTVSDIREIADLSYPAANNLVERLVSIGILEWFGDRKRNRAFLYRDYIRVFADDPEPAPGNAQVA